MQAISSLTLVLTERCNFTCPYCRQRKGKNTLTIEAVETFLDSLQPRLAQEVWLGFYGGEPLLAWPLIEKTVEHLQKNHQKKFHLSLTTNGSLLTKKHILFFMKNRFKLVLSYDGLAQRHRDPGSVANVKASLANLQKMYPEGYTINSVFTPATVSKLTASMNALMKQGHRRLQYTLDLSVPWLAADLRSLAGELGRLAGSCRDHFRKSSRRPLANFQTAADDKGIFACFAGRDRLALLPDNTVWGCYMFYDLLGHIPEHPDYRKYCFGKLEDFTADFKKDFPDVADHYAELRQDYFFTVKKELCSLCPELECCGICPVVAALATAQLAVIPDWICRVRQVSAAINPVFADSD